MLNRFGRMLCLVLMLALISISPASQALDKNIELPKGALNTPPMVKEESVSTYVPSEAAPGQGLAVNLMYSAKPRYKDGAPVAVVVPGGNGSQGLDFDMHSAQQGFVELRFAFPGGGKPGFSSTGIYDNRGLNSQEALRDVLRYAAGEISDYQGKKISELLPCHVSNKTIGAVGWSNGGNTLLVTLGKYGEQLPFVRWVAFYESPIGAMFFPPALGGAQDMLINKHYRQGTAATGQVLVDFRKLDYQANAIRTPGAHKKADEPEMPGVAYFDENANRVWDETSEFSLPYATDVGFDKQIYAPPVTRALLNLPQFQPVKSDKQPTKAELKSKAKIDTPFATYEESLAYFRERDGSLYIRQAIEQHPDMAFGIFASRLDHLQRQGDHPHIALLYNTLLASKAKFVRLNPSPAYVGSISFMKPATFVENRPNTSIEADTIDPYLEPEGLLPIYVYMEAIVCELADRVHTNKWIKTLEAPLVNYSNGAKPPEIPQTTGKTAAPPKDKASVKAEPASHNKGNAKAAPAANDKGTEEGATPAKADQPKKASSAGKIKKGTPEISNPKDWPFRSNSPR